MVNKKLVLRKETVRTLSDVSLKDAVGGTTSNTVFGCTGGLCMSAYTCPVMTLECPSHRIPE